MKIKSLGISLAVVSILSVGFSGCGSSSDDAPTVTTVTTKTGAFVDAPVQGLNYITSTQNGYTNDKGEFKYVSGETVEFKLGNLSLGTVDAGGLITPYTIAGVANGTDNNLSTNIALLLQNLDANRSNTDILDLSKLKDFNFSDINLSNTTLNMETVISNKLTAGDFDAFINTSDKAVINTATVKNVMKTFVESEAKKNNDVSKIIGKELSIVKCSDILGCNNPGTIKFTNTHITGTYDGENFSETYEKLDSGILKVAWEADDIEYIKFTDISNNVVNVCMKDTEEKAKICTTEESWVSTNIKDAFIENKSKNVLSKTLVTDFSGIKNKIFYKTDIWESNNEMHYNIDAMRIEDNNTIYGGYVGASDYKNTPSSYAMFNSGYIKNGVALFDKGNLTITGQSTDFNGNYPEYNKTTKVYKYDLTNKTIKIKSLGESFDQDTYGIFSNNETITFTNGSLYCIMYRESCWVDIDAIKPINEFLKLSNKVQ